MDGPYLSCVIYVHIMYYRKYVLVMNQCFPYHTETEMSQWGISHFMICVFIKLCKTK